MSEILMDGESFRYDAKGRFIGKFDRNGDEIIEDGESIRIPMMMLDASSKTATPTFDVAAHRPRQGILTGEQKARTLAAQRLAQDRHADAWRKPAPAPVVAAPAPQAPTVTANQNAADAAWSAMARRKAERWRNPAPRVP